jgi:hypothetical protein
MDTVRPIFRKQMYIWMTILVVGLSWDLVSQGEEQTIATETEKASYVTGVKIVRTLKQQGGEFNMDLVIKGMMDGLTGEKLLLTEQELQETMFALQNALKRKQPFASSPFQDEKRKPVQEVDPSALFVATIGAPQAVTPQPSAATQLAKKEQSFVSEQTFADLLAAQEQANADGNVQVALSDLARRHAETWIKTQPHQ